jgi:hypothetical protein
VKAVSDKKIILIVSYPPYSSDLSLFGFWLFVSIKTSLGSRVFSDADELLAAVIESLNEIQPSELQLVFHHWIERVKWVLANHGNCYYE